MKVTKITTEARAYSEAEAKMYIEDFRESAREKGYTVLSTGYTYKKKTKKGQIVAEGWLCKCVAEYDTFWEVEE